ncbi:hypothetical protein [Candidatus Galacturonibacter soehngenii]|uniref:Uncharacterized protein n=1 Tax=Candidatus Galacturonatibacter soehngenii TaxID=2307010 RepID=A0A7V7QK06_9FIRM|nr:hypothetical protein [Candidatus Galacturonibacter soehngenii]KAB1438052.1 hypothetical protein F7O84_10820 [Candidatus Galacturonibacter soehngenii]MBA4688769.1 hypothetical protein [Candidatus Galacturonibacter soehngenii]
MGMALKEYTGNEECFLPVFTESFLCEGSLYNASYIPTDDSVPTIMLEKVIKYPTDKIFYKNKINMVLITVLNSGKIRIDSKIEENKRYETALACATAAYKFNLVKNYLDVEVSDSDNVIPMHIHASNR